MERLTKRIEAHVYYTQGKFEDTIPAEMVTRDIRKCLRRLADYEDTGFEPWEIKLLHGEWNAARIALDNCCESLARVEAERDAAVKDIPHKCWKCAHADELPTCSYAHYKSSHPDCLGWEWRGTKSKEG